MYPMSCLHFHNLKRHWFIAVSTMDSLSRDWKVFKNGGSKTPTRQPAPVTHCRPGQNSRSASQTAVQDCCHLAPPKPVWIPWSLHSHSVSWRLLLAPGLLCSPLNKPSSLKCSPQATCPWSPTVLAASC